MDVIKANSVPAFWATLHMAGDYDHAKQICRRFVLEGACVQLMRCDYVYTGGAESGFTVRIMAYARFPKLDSDIEDQVYRLGCSLCEELGQASFSVETPRSSVYFETAIKK